MQATLIKNWRILWNNQASLKPVVSVWECPGKKWLNGVIEKKDGRVG